MLPFSQQVISYSSFLLAQILLSCIVAHMPEQTKKHIPSTRDPSHFIRRIYVEESCFDLPYTGEILERAEGIPVIKLPDRNLPDVNGIPYPESLSHGKRDLFLCKNRGKFFKPCPGTREYRCCNYQVLNIGMNCPMDCVYCILQAYLNNPWLSFFVNIDDLFKELIEAFDKEPTRFWRIGTGEFTDSLALDSLTGLSRRLIEFFQDKPQAVLELKTKTAAVDHLEGLNHGGRTITAWSLNHPDIATKEEIRTASIADRLHAAAKCASWGYKLAFHFDPVIYCDNWQEGYRKTISQLFAAVPKEKIVWISIGALRFLPALRQIATKRFPRSRFFHEEFVIALDGKNRYFRTQRVELYQFILSELKKHADPSTCIYFCMESDEIWQEVFGYSPEDRGGLSHMLDQSVPELEPQSL